MPANLHLTPRWFPHAALAAAWRPGYEGGGLQPWLQAFLYQLIRAMDLRRVVELGTWYGYTSAWLAQAVEDNGGGEAHFVDLEERHVERTRAAVERLDLKTTACAFIHKPSVAYLADIPHDMQFVFLDDDKERVKEKIAMISQRCARCLVAIHDAETQSFLRNERAVLLPIPPADGGGDLALLWA